MSSYVRLGPAFPLAAEPEAPALVRSFGHAVSGDPVKETRSGRVVRGRIGPAVCYVKHYFYRGWRGPLGGAFRNTFLARSRVAREWDALCHLHEHGLQPDLRIAMGERRTLGFLREGLIVTLAFPGQPLDAWLAQRGPAAWPGLWPALSAWLSAMHASGHRDRNLDPRNLLVAQADGVSRFAKIDSPRSFRVAPGSRRDRWVAADHARLRDGLAALGVTAG